MLTIEYIEIGAAVLVFLVVPAIFVLLALVGFVRYFVRANRHPVVKCEEPMRVELSLEELRILAGALEDHVQVLVVRTSHRYALYKNATDNIAQHQEAWLRSKGELGELITVQKRINAALLEAEKHADELQHHG